MEAIHSRKLWAGMLAAGIAGVFGVAVVTDAPATERRGGDATITMEVGGPPVFAGDENVQAGNTLTIVNNTKPQQIGPHFFTLAEDGDIPDSGPKFNKCNRFELKICKRIVNQHELSNNGQNIRKRKVDNGLTGWDTSFAKDANGDSWFTDDKGASHTRTVTAAPGQTLSYFCLIHPETMSGEIDVVTP